MPGKILDKDLADRIVSRYFSMTTPVFDAPMGLRLKAIREQMKFTQKKLADLLGLSQTDVSRLEAGKLKCPGATSEQFKSVLKSHFEHLLTGNSYYKYETINYQYNKQIRKLVGSR